MTENVTVAARIRPFNEREKKQGYTSAIDSNGSDTLLIHNNGGEESFGFDHIFGENSTQEQVYSSVGIQMVDNLVSGFNSTVFAYGQTGTGKSYTMMGNDQDLGLIPRIVEGIFEKTQGQSVDMKVSYLEIYMEKVRDLLSSKPSDVVVRILPKEGVIMDGLEPSPVSSMEDTLKLLNEGADRREIHSTSMNAGSSRSHTIFTIHLTSTNETGEETTSKINLVDLAGRENEKTTQVAGDRMKELSFINKSLFFLANSVRLLGEDGGALKGMSGFRDSKLTIILSDSLVGNSKTTIMAMMSPAADAVEESITTCKFAATAKKIKTSPLVNTQGLNAKQLEILESYKEKIATLEAELEEIKANPSEPSSAEVQARVDGIEAEYVGNLLELTEKLESVTEKLEDVQNQVIEKEAQLEDVTAQLVLASSSTDSLDSRTSSIKERGSQATRSSSVKDILDIQEKLSAQPDHLESMDHDAPSVKGSNVIRSLSDETFYSKYNPEVNLVPEPSQIELQHSRSVDGSKLARRLSGSTDAFYTHQDLFYKLQLEDNMPSLSNVPLNEGGYRRDTPASYLDANMEFLQREISISEARIQALIAENTEVLGENQSLIAENEELKQVIVQLSTKTQTFPDLSSKFAQILSKMDSVTQARFPKLYGIKQQIDQQMKTVTNRIQGGETPAGEKKGLFQKLLKRKSVEETVSEGSAETLRDSVNHDEETLNEVPVWQRYPFLKDVYETDAESSMSETEDEQFHGYRPTSMTRFPTMRDTVKVCLESVAEEDSLQSEAEGGSVIESMIFNEGFETEERIFGTAFNHAESVLDTESELIYDLSGTVMMSGVPNREFEEEIESEVESEVEVAEVTKRLTQPLSEAYDSEAFAQLEESYIESADSEDEEMSVRSNSVHSWGLPKSRSRVSRQTIPVMPGIALGN